MDSTIIQKSLVQKVTSYFLKIHFNIILPRHMCLKSGLLSSILFTKIVKIFLTIISCYDSKSSNTDEEPARVGPKCEHK